MSATWYGVAVTVKIDFDSGPWVASGSLSWSDVTNDVRSITTNRGRSSELSAYSPGSVTVVLNNRDRTYDPANTAGTYYGKFKPRRRIQILLGGTAVFTGFVTSWLLEWPEAGQDATTVVTAVDALDVLAGATLRGSAYGAAVLADSPSHYWPMQLVGESGSPAKLGGVDLADNATDTRTTMIGASGSLPLGAADGGAFGAVGATLPALSSLPAAIEAWVTVSPSVADYNQIRTALDSTNVFALTVFSEVSSAAFSVFYSNSTTNRTVSSGTGLIQLTGAPLSAGSHHIAAVVSGTTLSVYVDGAIYGTDSLAVGTYTYSLSMFLPGVNVTSQSAESPTSHFAVYGSALSADRILAHYLAGTTPYGHPYGERGGARIGRILDAIGWPSTDRTLSTGETVLGNWLPASDDALSACRQVEIADQGMFFAAVDGKIKFLSRQDTWTTTRNITAQATFGDGVGEIPTKQPFALDAESLDYTRNVVSVSYAGGSVTSKNETSTTAYGELPDSVNAQLIPSTGGWLARQLAAFRLRLRAVPTSRVPTLTVETFEDDGTASTYMTTLKALELGDRVRVIRRPNGTTDPIDLQLTLQGIRWRFSPNAGFSWQAYVSPAVPSYTEAPYLTVGDATYGKIGASDGNLVPF